MFVLDSLGMLSTEKEITDALNDKKQVRDYDQITTCQRCVSYAYLKTGQSNIPL